MPLNADAVLALRLPQQTTRVTDRDLLLFALSAGVVPDPLDPQGLRYGYEEGLQVFPTIFTVLGHPGPWWLDPALRITRHMLVQGAQRLEVLGRLEPGHAVLADNRVLEVVDKGAASGAMVVMERTLRDGDTGALLARMEAVTFCRADGGCGGQTRLSRESPTRPQRAPDWTREVTTTARQALEFRLNGDRNPLHATPAAAARAGYPRPILHGLCTYSLAAKALLDAQGASASLRVLDARFRGHVFPGEVVRISAWECEHGLAFEASVPERGSVVFDRGWAEFIRAPQAPTQR